MLYKRLNWVKNPINQFVAGSMFENVAMYVNHEVDNIPFIWRYKEKFVNMGLISDRNTMLHLYSSMDAIINVTSTECYPLAIVEGLALNVPCITSYNNQIYNDSEYLYKNLVVHELDNPYEIYEKMENVMQNREKIVDEIKNFTVYLRNKNKEEWKKFLN
jgi:glycosyltransferase involved in cell wall biosynthesis